MKISYDDKDEFIEINGLKYSIHLFNEFAFCPIGTRIEIVERTDGVITVKHIEYLTPEKNEK